MPPSPSLSSAFSAALSGLSASTRRAEVVSSNIANAQTPGYVRRKVELAALGPDAGGPGVQVLGIRRMQDAALLADRRLAQADAAGADVGMAFLKTAQAAFGAPDQTGSLGARLVRLETALTTASAQPGNDARLAEVGGALESLSLGLRQASATVQAARQSADTRIATEVEALNTALAQVDVLNDRIATDRAAGNDLSALLDQRQRLVDSVAGIVPLREVARGQDRIALYTTGGAVLLGDGPAKLTFTRSYGIVAEDGTLGSLALNGQPLRMEEGGLLAGGSLGALFHLRDSLAPQAQARLDRVAMDLAGRLAGTDSHAGLGWLTDRGRALDVTAETGLAARLAINPRLDPGQGGAVWRLRDGLSASQPKSTGNGGLLTAQAEALARPDDGITGPLSGVASGAASGAARSLSGLMSDMLGQTVQARLEAETRSSFSTARLTALEQAEHQDGVDTDAELQDLMQVEQAFGANAKVIRTLDDLLKLLLEV